MTTRKNSPRKRAARDADEERATLVGFGLAVERLREEAGMTREAVANRGGLTGNTITHIEKGLKTKPRWETMRRPAKGLGVEFSEVIQLAIDLAPGPAGERLRQREREAREIDIDALVTEFEESAAYQDLLRDCHR